MRRIYNLESIEHELVPVTEKDEQIINKYLDDEVELYVDETTNHVITESGMYVADLVENKEEE